MFKKKISRKAFITVLVSALIFIVLTVLIKPLDSLINWLTRLTIKKRFHEITQKEQAIERFTYAYLERRNFKQNLKFAFQELKYLISGTLTPSIETMAKKYIMSTDLFYGENKITKYIGYYDPYTMSCSNPLVVNS